MMGRQLIPIQPKRCPLDENGKNLDAELNISRRSRTTILVACDPCRRLKTKCDGRRPACRKCRNKGQECIYELPQDVLSRSSARKAIKNQLQRENVELRQLFRDLSRRPESEALDIFQRLRVVDDPIALARSIRQAELLLPSTAMGDHDKVSTVHKLEFDALLKSPIKIPAQPWTTVAGDGIVSELISSWFKWDNAFLYSFIDRDCFMQDIRDGDPDSAVYCSPFLVNAICAFRSYFSETIDMVLQMTKLDLKEQFLAEAKRQYDHGPPSIPKIQGLWILFAISSIEGDDRSGSLYRFASYDLLQSPGIPCLFPDFNYETLVSVGLSDQQFTSLSAQPPSLGGAISTFCQLAVLMSEVLRIGQWQKDNEDTCLEYHVQLKSRKAALAQLDVISESLPPALHHEHNFTPETCFLRVVMNTVAYTILRPLRPDTVLDEDNATTVQSALLGYCALDTEIMERYFATWSTPEFSTTAFLGPLNAGKVLLPLLPFESAQQLFPRICRLMRTIAARMPIAKYVMKGWQAALWSRNMDIPGPAEPYFLNLGEERERVQDMPTSLVVANIPDFEETWLQDWDSGELGFLLKKWSVMNITERERRKSF
ncbi:hypothetical protein FHL15_003271 [Xylaria flabelliformis]|uniref:Zn(2)-C6 fungal-type domain-containing protein n=1 Tax=Xylaria flabelliformis TaxID=2512241 RepID=A0A553I685_9PEZI|nr:hypothetical protein FHL15_003271 [Xylaria flabelliformis]